jgi:hydroxypyruvate isomerase
MPISRRPLLASLAATAALTRYAFGRDEPPKKAKNSRFAVNIETWFTDRPLLDRMRAAAAMGFPAVEFWSFEDKDGAAIGALAKELGIEVAQFTAWGFKPGLNEAKHHDAFLARVAKAAAFARQVGARMATVVAGDDVEGESQEAMHAEVKAALKRAAPIAEANDLMLILEPMNIRVDHEGHCLYGSDPALAICRAVKSTHVKINWDLYHLQVTEGDLCRRLRDGFDQVGYVQVADNPGRNEPGTGEVNWKRVLRELKDLGYGGYVGLECWPRDGEETAARRVLECDEF